MSRHRAISRFRVRSTCSASSDTQTVPTADNDAPRLARLARRGAVFSAWGTSRPNPKRISTAISGCCWAGIPTYLVATVMCMNIVGFHYHCLKSADGATFSFFCCQAHLGETLLRGPSRDQKNRLASLLGRRHGFRQPRELTHAWE